MGEQDYGVQISELRFEIKGLAKDLERIEKASDQCVRFQAEANRKLSHNESEAGNARRENSELFKEVEKLKQLEVKTRMDMIESFVNKHQAEHNDHHKSAQARQWALWMLIIATCVSSVAGLIAKLIMG